MARRSLWIAAGSAAFVVCLVAMVPASQLARRLPAPIVLQGAGGTIWSGHAAGLWVDDTALGSLEWSCRPWRLLMLQWSCRVLLRPPGGEIAADVAADLDGDLLAEDVSGRLPVAAFAGVATPAGWTGLVELDIERLRLAGQRPVEATGLVTVRALKAPGPNGALLGDFELVAGEGAVGTGTVTGRLRDLGGPLHVRGALELRPDGSYLLSGEVAPGPGAGPAIVDTLAFLGPPDPLGRRPFTIEGSW